MATKNASYDNAAYLAVLPFGGTIAAGSASASPRFVAFTTMLLKSVTIKCVTAGTVADIKSLIINAGSATSTTALCTLTAFAGTGTNILTTATLTQGDSVWIVKGTDATEVDAVGFELVILPGANVTA